MVKPGLYHAQVSFVLPSHIEPADRCFLYIDHLGASYIGCLLIEHNIFCRQVVDLLWLTATVQSWKSETWMFLTLCSRIDELLL